MLVNSVEMKLEETCNIKQFLESKNYNPLFVAVELNGEIVSKNKFEETNINDEDTLEIVSFVGGG